MRWRRMQERTCNERIHNFNNKQFLIIRMKKHFVYLFFALGIILLGRCDVIEGPYLEDNHNGGTVVEKSLKNILVMEFTGHTCKSCPKAHRTIDQLESIYEGRLISVAFHTGYFARTLSGEKFTRDFRTTQGAEMENYFEFASFPIGLVGNLDKARLSSYSSWPAEADDFLNSESSVDVSTASSYDENTKEIEVKVNLINRISLEGEIRLAVYLVEDNIVSWQKDEDQDPIDVEDYIHNHVFRTSAGSVWGEGLSESDCSANANVQIRKTLVMNPLWIPENCTVIAFLYDFESREVIQCSSELLIK